MSSHTRVALVTGANKGIGFAIVRDLCRQFSGDVVLTARDEARGQAAVQRLQAEGLSPRFHLLDIDDLQSIRAMRDFLRKEYGGLDVLVNNAGIAFKSKGMGARRGGGHHGAPPARVGCICWGNRCGGALSACGGPNGSVGLKEGWGTGVGPEPSPRGITALFIQSDLCVS